MCDNKKYDSSHFGDHLTNIRKSRWELYKKHQNLPVVSRRILLLMLSELKEEQ